MICQLNNQRLNKVLANYGICSRRKADFMIRDRKVYINGSLAQIGMSVNPDFDSIQVNGKELKSNHI